MRRLIAFVVRLLGRNQSVPVPARGGAKTKVKQGPMPSKRVSAPASKGGRKDDPS